MQLQVAAKPSDICCHLANTNEVLGGLVTAILQEWMQFWGIHQIPVIIRATFLMRHFASAICCLGNALRLTAVFKNFWTLGPFRANRKIKKSILSRSPLIITTFYQAFYVIITNNSITSVTLQPELIREISSAAFVMHRHYRHAKDIKHFFMSFACL